MSDRTRFRNTFGRKYLTWKCISFWNLDNDPFWENTSFLFNHFHLQMPQNEQQQREKNQTWPKVHVNNAQIVLSCYGERHVFFGVILIFHLKECYLFCHCGVLFNFGNVFFFFVSSRLFWVLSISGWDLLSYRSIYATKI